MHSQCLLATLRLEIAHTRMPILPVTHNACLSAALLQSTPSVLDGWSPYIRSRDVTHMRQWREMHGVITAGEALCGTSYSLFLFAICHKQKQMFAKSFISFQLTTTKHCLHSQHNSVSVLTNSTSLTANCNWHRESYCQPVNNYEYMYFNRGTSQTPT